MQETDTVEQLFKLIFGMNYGNNSENTGMLDSGGIEFDINAHCSKDKQKFNVVLKIYIYKGVHLMQMYAKLFFVF